MSVTIPVVGREVHLVARPAGEPTKADFALVDAPVAPPAADQVLVRNEWFSVDPYMRPRMNDVKSDLPPFAVGAPMDGGAVGTVVASHAASIPLGTSVLNRLGWREYATVDSAAVRALDTAPAPAQAYLGVLGVTGLTAYVGLKLIAPVRAGDVVFVSGAAGAVGIVAHSPRRSNLHLRVNWASCLHKNRVPMHPALGDGVTHLEQLRQARRQHPLYTLVG